MASPARSSFRNRWRATDYRKDEFDAFSAGGPAEEEGDGKPRPVVVQKRPGRNQPCYCGSGKKYKKCHLPQDEQFSAAGAGQGGKEESEPEER